MAFTSDYECLNYSVSGYLSLADNRNYADTENYCKFIRYISPILDNIFHHFVMIPLSFVIIISIFNKQHDTYRWIIFHQGVMNILMWILYDVYLYGDSKNTIVFILVFILRFVNQCGFASVAVLAINRFICLYFQDFARRFFTPLKIFFFLIFYDGLVCTYIYFNVYVFTDYYTIMCLIFSSFFMLLPFVLSIFIFFKVRTMVLLAKKAAEKKVLHDINRAAIICFVHPLVNIVYYVLIFSGLFISLQMNATKDVAQFSIFTLDVYVTFNFFQADLYMMVGIVDSMMILFLLRSYRRRMFYALSFVFDRVFRPNRVIGLTSTSDPTTHANVK